MNLQELSKRYFEHLAEYHDNNRTEQPTGPAAAAEFAKFVFHLTNKDDELSWSTMNDQQILFCNKQQITLKCPLQIKGLNA
jgi:hypothetical protein